MATETQQTDMSDTAQDRIPLDEGGETTLPTVEVLTGRGFVTGKSGSGKSNSASVVAEELLDRGFPLLVVDTDGEYWGLKQEYEILHVGADEECDLQVGEEHAGKLASLALEENVPIILDVSGYLDDAEADALVRETARELFAREKKLKKPFPILVEEVHEYIPEGGGLDETGEMLIRVAKRGRKRGLGLIGMSQRPADVKKDFITQCDWLLWHRLTWENDTKVVRRVVGSDYADAVQDLADGEGFLTADFVDADVKRVQVRRKHTFDAGATPDLDDFERPDLKSVSGDLVSELEEISQQEDRRQDRIAQLEARVEKLQDEKAELEDELESARDMRDMASQFAEAMQAGGNGDVASEKVDELVEERNRLRSQLEDRDDRIGELEERVEELEQYEKRVEQLDGLNLDEAEEAVTRLADALDMDVDGDVVKWRRKYQQEREKREAAEQRSQTELTGPDPLENRKVQTIVKEVQSQLSNLGEKERKMLRYYLLNGPASMSEAYKYAGGSPTSGAKSTKTRELRDANLVKKEGQAEYTVGLRDYLEDALDGFSEEEIDRVYNHLEEQLYDAVMEETPA